MDDQEKERLLYKTEFTRPETIIQKSLQTQQEYILDENKKPIRSFADYYLANKVRRPYQQSANYEQRVLHFLKTDKVEIQSKHTVTNQSPNHDYAVRCSSPGHLAARVYKDDIYRINLSKH